MLGCGVLAFGAKHRFGWPLFPEKAWDLSSGVAVLKGDLSGKSVFRAWNWRLLMVMLGWRKRFLSSVLGLSTIMADLLGGSDGGLALVSGESPEFELGGGRS